MSVFNTTTMLGKSEQVGNPEQVGNYTQTTDLYSEIYNKLVRVSTTGSKTDDSTDINQTTTIDDDNLSTTSPITYSLGHVNCGSQLFGIACPDAKAKLGRQHHDWDLYQYMPRDIQLLFDLIGHRDRRLYVNKWQISSIDEITKQYNRSVLFGQAEIIDIASRYVGMGNWIAIFVRKSDGALLLFHTGGSNGYEVEDNDNDIIAYKQATSQKLPYAGDIFELIHNTTQRHETDYSVIPPNVTPIHGIQIYYDFRDYLKN